VKPARLRPRASRDREIEVNCYRTEAGPDVAVRLVRASIAALDRLEANPRTGSPTLGKTLELPGLRLWRIEGFPLVWLYVERPDHLDFIRLLGERQDIAALIGRWDRA